MTTINTGSLRSPLPFKATVPQTTEHDPPPTRQSVTNAETYYFTLHYDQVRLVMPPPAL